MITWPHSVDRLMSMWSQTNICVSFSQCCFFFRPVSARSTISYKYKSCEQIMVCIWMSFHGKIYISTNQWSQYLPFANALTVLSRLNVTFQLCKRKINHQCIKTFLFLLLPKIVSTYAKLIDWLQITFSMINISWAIWSFCLLKNKKSVHFACSKIFQPKSPSACMLRTVHRRGSDISTNIQQFQNFFFFGNLLILGIFSPPIFDACQM